MNGTRLRSRGVVSALAGVVSAATVLVGFGTSAAAAPPSTYGTHDHVSAKSASQTDKELALHSAMRQLWGDHMFWTLMTVDAFFNEPKQLKPRLNRLLRNQRELGAAIAPYYGRKAGNALTKLLVTHIEQAVPVLQAAKDGEQAALKTALDAWYANAEEIAGFLSAANPANWPASATEPALRMHITQTTGYAVDVLKGQYNKAIKDFDMALHHMLGLADVLAAGIIAQFPQKF